MFEPKNEMGVIVLFSTMIQESGWEIVEIGSAFPDAILCHDGEIWRTEFEFSSSNFIDHRHDHRGCDLIVCWDNDYEDSPFPIIELKNPDWYKSNYVKSEWYSKEIEYWKRRYMASEASLRKIDNTQRRQDAPIDPLAQISMDEKKAYVQSVLRDSSIINRSKLSEQLGIARTTLNRWIEEFSPVPIDS